MYFNSQILPEVSSCFIGLFLIKMWSSVLFSEKQRWVTDERLLLHISLERVWKPFHNPLEFILQDWEKWSQPGATPGTLSRGFNFNIDSLCLIKVKVTQKDLFSPTKKCLAEEIIFFTGLFFLKIELSLIRYDQAEKVSKLLLGEWFL